ncbi:bifunctional DNA primase/polymerase [Vannielia litorea]|uniref:bifunctional DNA primase/polymerase n=1 Tax=Vannielia litorea TaxID=1217970 RepID=UPI001C98BBC6|nr:bifunctional DNA primase/polymerase [Vannielia litorea]MBY6153394.1 bifunctional DNA primase/polymerase [Vannielia litorea]
MAEQHTRPDIGQMKPLVEAGYTLIPLHRWDATRTSGGKTRQMGKAPIHRDWTKRSDATAETIANAMRSGNNVGVRLKAEDLVIDIDPRSIVGGVRTAREALADLDVSFSRFPIVRTGSGGLHIYMRKPANIVLADHLPDWKGIELKSRGRQVVAPGSLHPNGRMYRWVETRFGIDDLWLGAPMAPERLLKAGARATREPVTPRTGTGSHPADEIAVILSHMNVEDFREHDRWLQLMMAIHHASAGEAVDEFVRWCVDDPLYADDGEMIRYRWDSLRNHGVGLGTLYMHMREQGCAHLIDRRARVVPADEFGEVL